MFFGLFQFRRLRRLIKRRMPPIPEDRAKYYKKNLSIAYMFIAWNALGGVMYVCYTGKKDWPSYFGLKTDEELDKRPAVYYAEMLGIKEAKILSYSGFHKTYEDDYNVREEKPTTTES